MDNMKSIDLNCDMGESFGVWTIGADAAVMPWVSSVNIACGFHAGDPTIMRETVAAAVAAGVAIGAHVGLPDLAGFGRRAMAVTAQQVYDFSVVQIGALQAVAHAQGDKLTHMKPHGALYHMAEDDPAIGEALARAVHDIDPSLRLVGRANGALVAHGKALGLVITHEVFADRRYRSDGRLAPRTQQDAVIDEPVEAAQQAVDLALHGKVASRDGSVLDLRADSICVHGDRANAAQFAETLHRRLREAGVTIQRPASR